jgi:nucleoside-diphosphate-sugar epimerase
MRQELGLSPYVSLEDGIRKTAEWARETAAPRL